jgi:hypothetical protein
VAAMKGDDTEFNDSLSKVVDDAFANVSYLLRHDNASALMLLEDPLGMSSVKAWGHYWSEPLAIVGHAAVPLEHARFVFNAYEEYIDRIEGLADVDESARHLLVSDARNVRDLLSCAALDEIAPQYPLDFSQSASIRETIAQHPEFPIVVFAGPEGAPGAWCDIERVERVELLDCDTPYTGIATVVTDRKRFVDMIACELEAREERGHSGPRRNRAALEREAELEAEKYESEWTEAIAIYASWREL